MTSSLDNSSKDYSQTLRALHAASAGEFAELDEHLFYGDIEAHDEDYQRRSWETMCGRFQYAVNQATSLWGAPAIRLQHDSPDSDEWIPLFQSGFHEMAAWQRPDGNYVYILIQHEDRECPILVMAGVTV